MSRGIQMLGIVALFCLPILMTCATPPAPPPSVRPEKSRIVHPDEIVDPVAEQLASQYAEPTIVFMGRDILVSAQPETESTRDSKVMLEDGSVVRVGDYHLNDILTLRFGERIRVLENGYFEYVAFRNQILGYYVHPRGRLLALITSSARQYEDLVARSGSLDALLASRDLPEHVRRKEVGMWPYGYFGIDLGPRHLLSQDYPEGLAVSLIEKETNDLIGQFTVGPDFDQINVTLGHLREKR